MGTKEGRQRGEVERGVDRPRPMPAAKSRLELAGSPRSSHQRQDTGVRRLYPPVPRTNPLMQTGEVTGSNVRLIVSYGRRPAHIAGGPGIAASGVRPDTDENELKKGELSPLVFVLAVALAGVISLSDGASRPRFSLSANAAPIRPSSCHD
jgi:hypothetical protein